MIGNCSADFIDNWFGLLDRTVVVIRDYQVLVIPAFIAMGFGIWYLLETVFSLVHLQQRFSATQQSMLEIAATLGLMFFVSMPVSLVECQYDIRFHGVLLLLSCLALVAAGGWAVFYRRHGIKRSNRGSLWRNLGKRLRAENSRKAYVKYLPTNHRSVAK